MSLRSPIPLTFRPMWADIADALLLLGCCCCHRRYQIHSQPTCWNQGCIWRGVRGVWLPARGSWPPESSAEPLWWVDSNPLTTPDSIFLLNQYIQLYAAYQFSNLHARYSRSVSHSQSKHWPPSENLTNTALVETILYRLFLAKCCCLRPIYFTFY